MVAVNRVSRSPRLLVIGGSGRVGTFLRIAWRIEPPRLTPVWQARREMGLGGPIFDPLEAPDAFGAACREADAVLLLAGQIAGTPGDLAVNAELARAARQHAEPLGLPLIAASSAAVYGRSSGVLSEALTPAPVSDYGRAKRDMETVLAGMDSACVLRIGNVVGAGALFSPSPASRQLHVFEGGQAPERSFIGPLCLARAVGRLIELALAGVRLPDCVNLATPGALGMDTMLRAAGEPWVPTPAPRSAIARVELDVSRAIALGSVPEKPASADEMIAQLRRVTERLP